LTSIKICETVITNQQLKCIFRLGSCSQLHCNKQDLIFRRHLQVMWSLMAQGTEA